MTSSTTPPARARDAREHPAARPRAHLDLGQDQREVRLGDLAGELKALRCPSCGGRRRLVAASTLAAVRRSRPR